MQQFLIPAEVQIQHCAIPFQHAVGFSGKFDRLILAVHQPVADQRLPVVFAAGGVETPVFPDADAGIDAVLDLHILPAGGLRRHFQSEIGRLAHFPGQIYFPLADGLGVHPQSQVAVGLHPYVQVAAVVAQDRVAAQKIVRVFAQIGDPVGQYVHEHLKDKVLFHSVRHRVGFVRVELQPAVINFGNPLVLQASGGSDSHRGPRLGPDFRNAGLMVTQDAARFATPVHSSCGRSPAATGFRANRAFLI